MCLLPMCDLFIYISDGNAYSMHLYEYYGLLYCYNNNSFQALFTYTAESIIPH